MTDELKQEGMRDEFLATEEMYRLFVERNVIWRDMKLVIEGWIEECKNALSDPRRVNTLEALADYQGRIYMCQLFLSFPETAIQVIKAEREQKQLEKEENNG